MKISGLNQFIDISKSLLLMFSLSCVLLVPTISVAHIASNPIPRPEPPEPEPCPASNGGGKAECCEGTGSGGSVSYYTGEERIIQTDLVVNGIFPIKMVRQYASRSEYQSNLGYGWAFNHDMRLFEYPDNSVIVRFGCGFNNKYVYTGNAYQGEGGQFLATLNKRPVDGYFELEYLDGKRDVFDTQGRLVETWDASGNALIYEYTSDIKEPLIGSSPYAVDPSKPMLVARTFRIDYIREQLADGSLSGNYVHYNYDAATGRITSIASNDGRTISYTHDTTDGLTRGNLETVTGLENVIETYVYDDTVSVGVYQDYHNITSYKIGAASTPVVLDYDGKDRVEREYIGNRTYIYDWANYLYETSIRENNTDDAGLNPTSAFRTYRYDANGYITYIKDALGNEIKYTVDSNGLRTREEYYEAAVPDPVLIKAINRTFTTDGLMLSESVPLDAGNIITTTMTYDGSFEATRETSSSAEPARVFKTEKIYNHDANGRPTTIQALRRYKDDGTYLETAYTYNINGDVLTTTLPDGHIIVNEYDPAPPNNGRYVTRTYHIVGGASVPDMEKNYQYDSRGNRTHVNDARNHTTVTTYDEKNRRETVTNHLGHLTTYVYDTSSNLTHIKRDRTVPADQLDVTRLTYDGLNRLTKIERTDSGSVFITKATMRYDSAGNVIARGDAYGNETVLSYDLENRLIRITDAEGNYIRYSLNNLNQRIKTEYFKTGDILVRESSSVFDVLDRQTQLIGALGQTTMFTYDADGNRTTATDALNRPTTEYAYNTLSQLTSIKDATYNIERDNQTRYQYDDRDRLTHVIDPRGLITEYQYNELGQLRFLTSPDTGITEYTYDLAGNRETQKDARNITVTYGYDELDRITGKTYPTASLNVAYTYDQRTNGLGKLTGMSDAEGSTEYDYDEYGNLRESRRTTSGQTYITQYGYDLNDLLTSITYPSGRVVTYVRNTLGQVTSVTSTPNGGTQETVASSISYIPFGALEDMTFGNALLLDQTYDTDYRLTDQVLGSVYSRTYGYDDVNNITAITDNIAAAKSQGFSYDNLDRLDDATSTGIYGVLDYGYDDVGNRISLTLDGGTPTTYNYKPAANQLDNTTGTEVHSFGYDAIGNTTTKNAYTFTYDDTNRMVQATDGSATTSYGFNGKGERVRKSGVATTLYHYDNAGNLLFESDTAGNTQVEYIWLGSQRLAMVNAGALYYTHVDHLGTPQLMTDGSGAVAWQAEYDPFGEATVTMASVTNNLRFPGQYYDGETGLHYNYFRDYDPATGRYLESDPVGLESGPNTYIYANNNVNSYIDKYGLNPAAGIICNIVSGGIDNMINEQEKAIIKDWDRNNETSKKQLKKDEGSCYNDFTNCMNYRSKDCGKKFCDKKWKECAKKARQDNKDRTQHIAEQYMDKLRSHDDATEWKQYVDCVDIKLPKRPRRGEI